MTRRRRRKPATVEHLLKQMDRERLAHKKLKRKVRRSLYRRAGRGFLRVIWTGRRLLGLFYALGALELGGLVLGYRPAATGLIVLLGIVATLVLATTGRHRSWPSFRILFWGAFLLIGVGWLVAVSRLGDRVPLPGALAAIVLVGIGPWWAHCYRNRPTPEPHVTIDNRLEVFATLTRDKGVLPAHTGLHTFTAASVDDDGDGDTDLSGWAATVQLPPGARETWREVRSVAANIAAAYNVAEECVIVERSEDGVPSRANLIVLTQRNPTHEINYFDRSWITLKDGCFPFGIYGDNRRAWHCLYEPKSGPAHSLISGDTRTGKSATVSLLITQATMTGFVVPFVADPQGGQSLPEWAGPGGKAEWIAWNPDEIWRQTNAIMRLMQSRNQRLARREWIDPDGVPRKGFSYFDPADITDMPIVDWTLDEAHNMLAIDEYAALVEQIAKMASKCGVRINLVTQYPAIHPDLGGRTGLRSQLSNIVCLRNSGKSTGTMILPSDWPSPFDIPKVVKGQHTKGTLINYCPAPLGDRASNARAARVENAFKWADHAVEHIRRPLTQDDKNALGDDYATWRERFAARDATPIVFDLGAARAAKAAATPTRVSDRIKVYLSDPGANGRTGVISTQLEVPMSTVSTTLKRMADVGQVVQIRRGEWALGEESA